MKQLLRILLASMFAASMLPEVSCTTQGYCMSGRGYSELMSDGNYVRFVESLRDNAPYIIDNILQGDLLHKGDRVEIVKESIPVSFLKATQNEIGLTDSLAFPLKSAKYMLELLSATENTVLKPKGIEIVVAGANVIDGHHRWSTIALINPRAKIGTMHILGQKNAIQALKVTQAAILATQNTVPTSDKQGVNMLTMDASEIEPYIQETIKDDVVEALQKFWNIQTPDEVVYKLSSLVRKNLEIFKRNNVDYSLNITRNYMPQTDDFGVWSRPLGEGMLDVNIPSYQGGRRKYKYSTLKRSKSRKSQKSRVKRTKRRSRKSRKSKRSRRSRKY